MIGWWGNDYYNSKLISYPDPISIIKPKPLEKYTVENLSKTEVKPVKLILRIIFLTLNLILH